ncbi:MAG: hypothetical protein M1544_02565 [Candidatus Marsarchaeota archaeon]|nr:hypothetical protein [Candidatus Marsarchaeota archaeon]
MPTQKKKFYPSGLDVTIKEVTEKIMTDTGKALRGKGTWEKVHNDKKQLKRLERLRRLED